MSWSISALGRAGAVRKSIADQFSRNTCAEPEETVRQNAAKLLDEALAAQDESQPVEVSASGSQSYKDWTAKTGVSNQLTMQVRPLHGFVE